MNTTMKMTISFLGFAFLSACSTTHFVSTWKDPDASFGKMTGEKVAAFFISDNEASRRPVEDALASELTARGGQGMAGYTLLSPQEAQDKKVAAIKLAHAGVVAVVTMRVISEDQQSTPTPGSWHQVPTYRRWGGYWYPSWKTVYEPGQVRTDNIVRVETLIYAMDSKKLIWGGISKTTNPGKADAFVKELAAQVDKEIARSGLIQ